MGLGRFCRYVGNFGQYWNILRNPRPKEQFYRGVPYGRQKHAANSGCDLHFSFVHVGHLDSGISRGSIHTRYHVLPEYVWSVPRSGFGGPHVCSVNVPAGADQFLPGMSAKLFSSASASNTTRNYLLIAFLLKSKEPSAAKIILCCQSTQH